MQKQDFVAARDMTVGGESSKRCGAVGDKPREGAASRRPATCGTTTHAACTPRHAGLMDRRPAAFAATRTQDALTWRHQVSSAGHTESRSSAQAGMEPSPCARSSRRRPSTPTRLRRAESRPNLSTNPQPAAKNAPRPDRAAPAVHHWAAVCRHFLDAPTSHSDPTPSACPPVPQSTSQEPANRRFAGTSKRLKGLEPSTFCMASRP
jgi:hypothetical protein